MRSRERSRSHGREKIDPDTGFERYTYIGPQAYDILGYTPEELMVEQKHFPRMVHPDDRARIRTSVIVAEETGVWDDTYRVLRRDGKDPMAPFAEPTILAARRGAGSVAGRHGRRDGLASRVEMPEAMRDDARAEPSAADHTPAEGR